MSPKSKPVLAILAGATLAFHALPAHAQTVGETSSQPTYADIADLADSAGVVVLAQVKKMLRVEDERAPGLRPGYGRFYIEAETKSLLTGSAPLGESVKYLVDVPLDSRGKPPKLKKTDVFLFARAVPGRPGELQLVTPTAQRPWSEAGEARLRGILKSLVSSDAPAEVTGVRELFYVPGNLAGQGETQIFLTTKDGSAASITVRHQPGSPPAWGVSFSELVADVGNPPQRDTLTWYRLACFLPNSPPPGVNVSEGYSAKQQAEADYRMVLGELGVCERHMS
ncbi:hypothetical protein [Novosphingobium malaysiense]|uniref:Uncharacterized protein n=1 Tax=Novosphingobium malaysiense TaxID=1348853 RepID=A0A0B1ZP34_9SPHN|nr:hypothetical protein [Novosphingobium malaysiense]KHK92346.1 hypothetical protein LK12_05885 [Novosphingobium malaysiense]